MAAAAAAFVVKLDEGTVVGGTASARYVTTRVHTKPRTTRDATHAHDHTTKRLTMRSLFLSPLARSRAAKSLRQLHRPMTRQQHWGNNLG